MTRVLDGWPLAERLKADVAAAARDLASRGITAALAIVRGGGDPGARAYTRQIVGLGDQVNIKVRLIDLPSEPTVATLHERLATLNDDQSIHGMLVALPLPKPLTVRDAAAALSPAKDVDGMHPLSAGRLLLGEPTFVPATATAVLELLRDAEIPLQGRHAVVIGRSNIVGKPVALLLLAEHATVTICHTRTVNLAALARQADVLVAAAGSPELVRGEWIKPGAVVIDVGTNWVEGRWVGDVCLEEAKEVAAAISPVPDGVGPLTNILLLRNVIQAATTPMTQGRE